MWAGHGRNVNSRLVFNTSIIKERENKVIAQISDNSQLLGVPWAAAATSRERFWMPARMLIKPYTKAQGTPYRLNGKLGACEPQGLQVTPLARSTTQNTPVQTSWWALGAEKLEYVYVSF